MTTRILLIEDNAKDQRLIEIALAEATSFEHTLQAKKSLEEGLAHMDAHPTDVVLLDAQVCERAPAGEVGAPPPPTAPARPAAALALTLAS